MNKRLIGAAIALACFVSTAPASADVSGMSTAGVDPLRNTTFVDAINFSDDQIVTAVAITINWEHTNVGALTASLSHGGQSITLIDTGLVDNSNLGIAAIGGGNVPAPYTFNDQGSIDIASAATAPGVGNQIELVPSSAGIIYLAANNETFGSAFGGQSTAGDWTLTVVDAQGGGNNGGTGVLDGWSLYVTAVPEPAPLMLLSVGALMLLVRKRWFGNT